MASNEIDQERLDAIGQVLGTWFRAGDKSADQAWRIWKAMHEYEDTPAEAPTGAHDPRYRETSGEENRREEERLDAIGQILAKWLLDGDKDAYLDGEGPLPAHPELYYRHTGEWRGWTLLRDDAENRKQDAIEEQAWSIWKAMHENEDTPAKAPTGAHDPGYRETSGEENRGEEASKSMGSTVKLS